MEFIAVSLVVRVKRRGLIEASSAPRARSTAQPAIYGVEPVASLKALVSRRQFSGVTATCGVGRGPHLSKHSLAEDVHGIGHDSSSVKLWPH